jgi:ornithine cyclodeaminase/alanine dehydrogenase-like protein (mu-crystallin family)
MGEAAVDLNEAAQLSSASLTLPAHRGKRHCSGRAEFLYLDQEAVLAAGVLDMRRAMSVVADALTLYQTGQCRQPHKVVLRESDDPRSEDRGRINGLFALLGGNVRAMGMKWIASFPTNLDRGLPRGSGLIILNSPDTGLPLALLDGTLISAVRTGAVTALGARYLAPRGARRAGMVGAGVQARTQILGLMSALPELEEIRLVDRFPERAQAVSEECRNRWQAPVVPVGSIAEALEGADVAVTLTTAHEPLVRVEHIKHGALTIQLAGHECEFDLVAQCQKVVADSWEVVKHRGVATPALMHAHGLLRDEDIYAELGELILGRKPGRETERERIHFVHNGMGVEDVALAFDVYRTACPRNLGQHLTLWEKPLWL